MENNELKHYGVKGMKWGVRRYEKNPGSYTKKGLEIFNKKLNAYEQADQKVKSLKGGDKAALKTAKVERRRAKQTLNKSYDQLRWDARSDKGKELASRGRTVAGTRARGILGVAAVNVGAVAAQQIVSGLVNNSATVNTINKLIAIGGAGVQSAILANWSQDVMNLRAYRAHHRRVK